MNDTALATAAMTATAGFLYGVYYARKRKLTDIESTVRRLNPDQSMIIVEDEGIATQVK